VGRELRPREASGDPAFDNLRAAGSVVGGYDLAAEKSGAGVSDCDRIRSRQASGGGGFINE